MNGRMALTGGADRADPPSKVFIAGNPTRHAA
jgi:hypothetical protein